MESIGYKVEKIKTMVEILIDDNANQPFDAYLFLNQFSRFKKGEETISEFLESDKFMIPIVQVSSGDFIMLNKNELLYVKEKEVNVIQNQKNVKLHFKNQISLKVELMNVHSGARGRVLDYLNNPLQFLQFIHSDSNIYINKNKILKIQE